LVTAAFTLGRSFLFVIVALSRFVFQPATATALFIGNVTKAVKIFDFCTR
jgi:hypothetical protein